MPATLCTPSAARLLPGSSLALAFLEVARDHAAGVAIHSPEGTWTYGQLSAQVGGWAARLEERNIGSGERVVVLMDTTHETIAIMLACLCLGLVYVVLDPDFPAARLELILRDAQPAVACVSRARAAELAHSFPALPLMVDEGVPGADGLGWEELAIRGREVLPSALAYISYTSGTTGRPKGVAHPQANILHEVRVHTAALGLQADDRFSLLYSPSVIGSVRDIFGALLNGATLCPFPLRRQGFPALRAWLEEAGVTQYHSVPIIFRELMRCLGPGEVLPSVRVVFLAGDKVSAEDVRQHRRHFSATSRFYTGIGASEATSIYTHWFVPRDYPLEQDALPTGRSIPEKEVWVADPVTGERLPAGMMGEIRVSSEYLAAGYWGQPDLTRAAFAELADGARVYSTGDLGRFDEQGWLWHHGRADRQVKISGQRIELEAIERALRLAPAVQDCAVKMWNRADGTSAVAAYVVFHPGRAATAAALRAGLLARLPEAAVPAVFLRLDCLPLSATSKVDWRALPNPEAGSNLPLDEAFVAPGTPVERDVAALFGAQLGLVDSAVSATADFRELGGGSLQMIRLGLALRERFGLHLRPEDFSEPVTVRRVAGLVASSQRAAASPGSPLILAHAAAAAAWPDLPFTSRPAGFPGLLLEPPGRKPGAVDLLWLCQSARALAFAAHPGHQRRVWVMPSGHKLMPGSQVEIESFCRQLIAERWPSGLPAKVICGGFCNSGLIALCLARELARQGVEVAELFLVDCLWSHRARWVAEKLVWRVVCHAAAIRQRSWREAWPYFRQALQRWRGRRSRGGAGRALPAENPGGELAAGWLDFSASSWAGPVTLVFAARTWQACGWLPGSRWPLARFPRQRTRMVGGTHFDFLAEPALGQLRGELDAMTGGWEP